MVETSASIDYIVFALTLAVPTGISIYFGCVNKQHTTASSYFYGTGKLKAIPIGLSLFGSAISGSSIIGIVSETYIFGTQYLISYIGTFIALLIQWKFVLPIFCGNLQLKSPYEYYELRFNSTVRIIVAVLYAMNVIISLSLCLYITGIVLSDFSGFNLHICCVVTGSVCTAYTMLGGFTGVIWTDVFQTILIIASCLFTLIKGIMFAGGISNIWSQSSEGHRLQFFNLDPNPFIRNSFWSALIGMTGLAFAYKTCASCPIQRFLALKDEREVRKSTTVSTLSALFVYFVSGLTSLCIYSVYKGCDPVVSGKIQNPTQLLIYFINDKLKNDSGFRGIFTAGILSAGLSTISAELNALSGLLYYDILQKLFKLEDDGRAIFIMKATVLGFGMITMILAPLLHNFRNFVQISFTMYSWTYGALAGVLVLAIAVPKSNSWVICSLYIRWDEKGAIFGTIVSVFTLAWISINAMYYDLVSAYRLPLSVENCTDFLNYTIAANKSLTFLRHSDEAPIIYKLSFMYYVVLGTIITIIVGVIVSYITGPNNIHEVDARLIIPCLRPHVNVKQSD